MKRGLLRTGLLGAALLTGALAYALVHRTPVIERYVSVDRLPRIRPDYVAAVIPPNIAPLNFRVDEPGTQYVVVIRSAKGQEVRLFSKTGSVMIPQRAWRSLLQANRGGELIFDVYVQAQDRQWHRYDSIRNAIAPDEMDPYLMYRLIDSEYNLYFHMGLYQRDLRNYDESVVLRSDFRGVACMNCHTFLNNSADQMIVHIRGGASPYGNGMLLMNGATVRKIDTQTRFSLGLAAFTAWHPSGRLVVFSMNKIRQFFHTARPETRDVVDMDSDLAVYLLASRTVTSTSAISSAVRLETWPTWSPDGRYLYFCSAPVLWADRETVPPEQYRGVRYDLMRISYDISTGTWGNLETVLSAAKTGLSIAQPRISPEGRFLAFCMSEYSTFPSFQPSSDLYLMDLESGRYGRMACNSDRSESWHSWSSNSRWLVFSSKRDDGQSIRPYFSYVDENGVAHKPFVMPKEDPAFYDSFVDLFQMPEFVKGPVRQRGAKLARAIGSAPWERVDLPVTSATQRPGGPSESSGEPSRGATGPAAPKRK